MFAVFDQEHSREELVARPTLYSKGLKDNFLSWEKYFGSCLEGILHGLLIFMVAYCSFDASLSRDGMNNDLRSDGNLCYISVILAVTMRIMFDTNNVTSLVFMASFASIMAYFLFVYCMGLIPELDIYDQLPQIWPFTQQFFIMFLLSMVALPFIRFYRAMKDFVYVDEEDHTEHEDVNRSHDNEKASDKNISIVSLENKLLKQASYTGFAFSGEMGNVKSLTSARAHN